MTHMARASHIGSCLSCADILAVLYGGILRVDPARPDWPHRDRFIMSKGHAAAALYAVLAERGFFPVTWLEDYCREGSSLLGHVTHLVPGVEVSTGSLGHGLSIGCGMALAGKRSNHPYRVFVLLSDGECQEGSVWEAVLFAGHHALDNLVAIVDYNKFQAFGRTAEVLDLEPLPEKWRSFSWSVTEVDGHDLCALYGKLSKIPLVLGRPTCVIAHTVKGKGVPFMENQLIWHYKSVNERELEEALRALGCEL